MAFTTSKTFTVAIENIAKDLNITHMDAILYYCDKEGIEPDSVGSLISKGLKEKIEANDKPQHCSCFIVNNCCIAQKIITSHTMAKNNKSGSQSQ